jgi:hypothetical protein
MNSLNGHAPFPVSRIALTAVFSLLLLLGAVSLLLFALYYDPLPDNTVKIQTGDLDIAATYVRIEGTRIDTDEKSPYFGRFIAFTQDVNRDLSKEEENIFTLDCAAPTMTQTATCVTRNEGELAFNYEVRICDLVLGTEDSAASEALSRQMLIRIACGTEAVEFRLSDHDAAESVLTVCGLAPQGESTFTVTATFLDDTAFLSDSDPTNDFCNSDALNGALGFDITLIATQTIEIASAE